MRIRAARRSVDITVVGAIAEAPIQRVGERVLRALGPQGTVTGVRGPSGLFAWAVAPALLLGCGIVVGLGDEKSARDAGVTTDTTPEARGDDGAADAVETGPPAPAVFFYSRPTARGVVAAIEPTGEIRLLQDDMDYSPWSHIVVSDDAMFFHDREARTETVALIVGSYIKGLETEGDHHAWDLVLPLPGRRFLMYDAVGCARVQALRVDHMETELDTCAVTPDFGLAAATFGGTVLLGKKLAEQAWVGRYDPTGKRLSGAELTPFGAFTHALAVGDDLVALRAATAGAVVAARFGVSKDSRAIDGLPVGTMRLATGLRDGRVVLYHDEQIDIGRFEDDPTVKLARWKTDKTILGGTMLAVPWTIVTAM